MKIAEISEDFFKFPIQTTLKENAQCLWVPVVVCGALKIVCLIVNICWNRCFSANNRPNHVIDPRAKDPCMIIPQDVIRDCIFPYLNLRELGVCRSINHEWKKDASVPILWKSAIYREIAFSSKNWEMWDPDFIKDVNEREEMLSLPEDIAGELRRSVFPGQSFKKTHVLVRMPKGLTINKLGELAKKYFPDEANGYHSIKPEIANELGDTPADKSIWLLMTTVLPESINKNYIQQKKVVAEFAKTRGAHYQVPTTLEAVTCILAKYSHSKTTLFNHCSWISIRCQDEVETGRVYVGGCFTSPTLRAYGDYAYGDIGTSALRKF